MELFHFAIPDCPERTPAQKVYGISKPILASRLRTLDAYYATYMASPDANPGAFKHVLRVLKYTLEDLLGDPGGGGGGDAFLVSEIMVVTDLLWDLAAIVVAGQEPEDFQKGLAILRRLRNM
jgi:hypothetical protein